MMKRQHYHNQTCPSRLHARRLSLWMLLIFLIAVSMSGCGQMNQSTSGQKLAIVATLFPQYDFARQIAGDKAEVTLLLPAGMESHSYEPTPADIIKISKSDIFLYTGDAMEPWAKSILSGITNDKLLVTDVSANVPLSGEDGDHEELGDHEGHAGHSHLFDPHIWTSPRNAEIMVDNVAAALSGADPDNAAYYQANASAYKAKLLSLDQEFRDVVENGSRHEIVFAGRFAFHYFAKAYGLDYVAAYDSCSAETEPSARVFAEIIDTIQRDHIPVIYYEELTDPKVARSISEETGAEILLLHSAHNVSKEDFESGATYLSLMEQNVKNLKKGLN